MLAGVSDVCEKIASQTSHYHWDNCHEHGQGHCRQEAADETEDYTRQLVDPVKEEDLVGYVFEVGNYPY